MKKIKLSELPKKYDYILNDNSEWKDIVIKHRNIKTKENYILWITLIFPILEIKLINFINGCKITTFENIGLNQLLKQNYIGIYELDWSESDNLGEVVKSLFIDNKTIFSKKDIVRRGANIKYICTRNILNEFLEKELVDILKDNIEWFRGRRNKFLHGDFLAGLQMDLSFAPNKIAKFSFGDGSKKIEMLDIGSKSPFLASYIDGIPDSYIKEYENRLSTICLILDKVRDVLYKQFNLADRKVFFAKYF